MALHNTEMTFNQLMKNPSDIVITSGEAAEIWKVFRKHPIRQSTLEKLDYRAFLQAAMIAALDGSAAMGFIKALFTSAYKPNATVKKIIKKLLKEALKQYFKRKNGNEDLYMNVISAIAYHDKFYFDSINQGAEI